MGNMKTTLKIPIAVLATIALIGTIGFHLIEDVALLESLYWTIVTMTTVGYGDIVPATEEGKIFAMVLMAMGVGTLLYVLTLVGRNIIEGRLWAVFTGREKRKEMEKMKDHLVVCGYGGVGRPITQELLLGNEKVVVIDKNEEMLRKEIPNLPYIAGDATKEGVLEAAKINEAKGIFAALPDDSDNILLTLSALDINPNLRVITKAETTEGAKHLRRAGAEAVVSPDREGGIRLARSFLHPEITSFYDHLLMGDIGRAGTIQIPSGGNFDGVSIKKSKIRKELGVSIIAIKRGEEIITNPDKDEEMKGGDTLIVMGTLSQIKKLRKRAKK